MNMRYTLGNPGIMWGLFLALFFLDMSANTKKGELASMELSMTLYPAWLL